MFRSSFSKGMFVAAYCLFLLFSAKAAFADPPPLICVGCNNCKYDTGLGYCMGWCNVKVHPPNGDCSGCNGCDPDPIYLFIDGEWRWWCTCRALAPA